MTGTTTLPETDKEIEFNVDRTQHFEDKYEVVIDFKDLETEPITKCAEEAAALLLDNGVDFSIKNHNAVLSFKQFNAEEILEMVMNFLDRVGENYQDYEELEEKEQEIQSQLEDYLTQG